jgi:hypothetical protein
MSTIVTQLKNASQAPATAATKSGEPNATAKPAAGRKAKAKPETKKTPAKKAVEKAATATKATAKATAPKTEPTERRGAYSNDATIHVLRTDHGLRGLRAEALDALKDGMTVGDFKKALAKREAAGSNRLSTYVGFALKTALAAKLITVK